MIKRTGNGADMSYRKSIKGESNQANEEFSHNRINIEMGASGIILAVFAISLVIAAIAYLVINYGWLIATLVIGSFVLLFLGAGIVGVCFVAVHISDARTKIGVNKILAQTVVAGQVVAYKNADDTWYHLSAEHVAAGIADPQVTVKELPSPDPRWDAVLDLRREGKGMHAIAKELNVPYQRVRQFLNQVERNNAEV